MTEKVFGVWMRAGGRNGGLPKAPNKWLVLDSPVVPPAIATPTVATGKTSVTVTTDEELMRLAMMGKPLHIDGKAVDHNMGVESNVRTLNAHYEEDEREGMCGR